MLRRSPFFLASPVIIGLLIIYQSGCARWSTDPARLPPKPTNLTDRAANDEALVDLVIWPLPKPTSQSQKGLLSEDPFERIWREVDELAIPQSNQAVLAANGLRAGKIRHFEELNRLFHEPKPEAGITELLEKTSTASTLGASHRSIRLQNSVQKLWMIGEQQRGKHNVLARLGNQTVGRSLQTPHFQVRLEPDFRDDGRVAIRVTPQIEHGAPRTEYVASEAAFRTKVARQLWVFEPLTFELVLDENETLIIAPTSTPFGLGKKMLTSIKHDQTTRPVAMLIHLSRSPRPQL